MADFQEVFKLRLVTKGPVYIGSGHEYSKKEYLFLNNSQIGIFSFIKLYNMIKKKGLSNSFEKFYTNPRNNDFDLWLKDNGIRKNELNNSFKYVLKCDESIGDNKRNVQIMEFVKDSYGNPYIPGSSVKGMLRTILLYDSIIKNNSDYDLVKKNINKNLETDRVNKKNLLKNENKTISSITFNTLTRNEKRKDDAVNDYMSGIIVADSKPLKTDDLILVPKIERNVEGKDKNLNLFRECLKPGLTIDIDITIDKKLCNINEHDIINAINIFSKIYNSAFVEAFSSADKINDNEIFIGGGSGFVSKTVDYALFGKKEGTKVVQKIFEKTTNRVHKHNMDMELGVSPHIIKYTKFNNKYYQMGLCSVEIV